MDNRSFASASSASPPSAPASPSVGYPTNGNPSLAVPATVPGDYWFYQLGEEVRAVIVAAGLTPDRTALNQLAKAIQSSALQSANATGTANAITAVFTNPITALTNGLTLYVRPSSANTVTLPTFTPNSGVIAAKNIVKGSNTALAAGDIAGYGHWLMLQYDLSIDGWVLLNPATGISSVSLSQFTGSRAAMAVGAAAAANGTIGSSGWHRLPDGSIKQWATMQCADTVNVVWTFPIAFPNYCEGIKGSSLALLAGQTAAGPVAGIFHINALSATSVTTSLRNTAGAGTQVWFFIEATGK